MRFESVILPDFRRYLEFPTPLPPPSVLLPASFDTQAGHEAVDEAAAEEAVQLLRKVDISFL